MTTQDTIGQALTHIRNASRAHLLTTSMPFSKTKRRILEVLQFNGYIKSWSQEGYQLIVDLKYYRGKPVITYLRRLSKPSKRVYASLPDIHSFRSGLGMRVLSTNRGILSDREAIHYRTGGEVLFEIQ